MTENEANGQSELSETSNGVSAESMKTITDKINETFNGVTEADLAETAEPTEKPVVSARETARRQSVKQEQADELDEEGLTTVNDPEGHGENKDEKTEVEGEAVEPVVEETTEELPTLDPNLRFVATEFGWTDDKINKLLKVDPELAQETFSRMADAYTNLSRSMLNPNGPQVAPGTHQNAAPAAQPQATVNPLDALFSADSLKQFAESNGQEMVDKFLKPFAEERQAMQKSMNTLQAYVEVQERRAVASEATTVVSKLSEKFGDLYGKDSLQLSEAQQTARRNLGGIADQIRAGAKQQGRELTVTEALNRAHLIVSADHSRQAVRKDITEQVQKRNKQITAKPSQRRNPVSVNAKSDDQATDAYLRKAAELGIEVS